MICPFPVDVQVPDWDMASGVSYMASAADNLYADDEEINEKWAMLEETLSGQMYRYDGGLPGWNPYEQEDSSGHQRAWSFAERQAADEAASFACTSSYAKASDTTLLQGLQWDTVRRYRATFAPPPTVVPSPDDPLADGAAAGQTPTKNGVSSGGAASSGESFLGAFKPPPKVTAQAPPMAPPKPLPPLPERVIIVTDQDMQGEQAMGHISNEPGNSESRAGKTGKIDLIAAARVAGSLWGQVRPQATAIAGMRWVHAGAACDYTSFPRILRPANLPPPPLRMCIVF